MTSLAFIFVEVSAAPCTMSGSAGVSLPVQSVDKNDTAPVPAHLRECGATGTQPIRQRRVTLAYSCSGAS